MLVDLHVHSHVSDGTLSPTEVVIHAKEKGLHAIALTDHDTVDGLDEAIEAGALYLVEVIAGIELSAEFTDMDLHFLGYCIDYKNKDFLSKLRPLRDSRQIRNANMLTKLNELGFKISISEDSNVTTRAHFGKALYEEGYVSSIKEAFDLYLSPGKPGYLKRKTPTPRECIDLIHSAGGIAILAHPTLYGLDMAALEKLVGTLAGYGLDGIEAIYPLHTPEEEAYLTDISRKYNLIISGGSDFHGSNKPGLEIATGYGNLEVPYFILEQIKNKAGIKNE